MSDGLQVIIEKLSAENTEQKQLIKELVERLEYYSERGAPHLAKVTAELLTKAKAHV